MNRKTRRASQARGCGEWAKVQPNGRYDDIGACDERDLLVSVFRSLTSVPIPAKALSEQQLFDGIMELIEHGLISIWFSFDGRKLRVKSQVENLEQVGAA